MDFSSQATYFENLFPGSTQEDEIDRKAIRNKTAFHSDVGLIVLEKEGIRVIPLNNKDGSIQRLNPRPSLSINFTGLVLNQDASLLALIGNSKIVLLNLSLKNKVQLQNGAESTDCKSFLVDVGRHSIQKVSWHPSSTYHLVVLTEEFLSIYNVRSQRNHPEQKFPIPVQPVSFTFGGSSHVDSWQRFVIYVLNESGAIYALCPVIPYECLIPEIYFTTLEDRIKKLRNEVLHTVQGDLYDLELRWLREVKGELVVLDTNTPTGVKRIDQKQVGGGGLLKGNVQQRRSRTTTSVRRSASVFSLDDDDDSDSDEYFRDGGSVMQPSGNGHEDVWVTTQAPGSYENLRPILQGPINRIDETVSNQFECTDILCLPTTPTVLVHVFRDLLLEVNLIFEDVTPRWGKDPFGIHRANNPALLYERVDLDLPVPAGTNIPPCLEPSFPQKKNEIFIRHGSGIHSVTFPWLEILHNHLFPKDSGGIPCGREGVEEMGEIPDLPISEIRWLLNTMPLSELARGCGLVGFSLVTFSDPMVLVFDTYMRCHCMEVEPLNLGVSFLSSSFQEYSILCSSSSLSTSVPSLSPPPHSFSFPFSSLTSFPLSYIHPLSPSFPPTSTLLPFPSPSLPPNFSLSNS
eukprot:TRINITY_DN6757_c0_g1_i3.p1 TRINITY_DN6757_c0_g1~~TRINITY_DN6757_c0_g1_i3.p1  ORF type:complete len:630 (-),score=130.68 TRINITY_DN6757_c0_g1_i3:83-1972(-)